MVSHLSAVAEYHPLAHTKIEISWLNSLFKDLMIALSSIVRCDNINSIALTSSPVFHSITKYLGVDYHCVCDKCSCQRIG